MRVTGLRHGCTLLVPNPAATKGGTVTMTFEEAIEQCGWNETSQVSVLLQYIDNQCDDAGFEEFLEQFVAEELAIDTKWEHLREEKKDGID
jgi:hypothetical protein